MRSVSLASVTVRTAMYSHVTEDALLQPAPISPPPIIDNISTQQLEPEKEFIITLETLPILWDKTHKNYVNKYKRNEALQKLLLIYKKLKPLANVQDVKNKINILRSNYRRELKKILTSKRSGAGADEVYTPKNWSFEYLGFLNKFEQPVHQTRAIDDMEEENNLHRSQQIEQGTESQDRSSLQNTGSVSSVNEIAPPPPPSPKIKKSMLAKQSELLDRACAYLSEPTQISGNSIAFEWAETLNRLDATQRLFAKKAINDILFEAELGNLDRYSVKINKPSYTPSPASTSPSYSQTSFTYPPTHSPSSDLPFTSTIIPSDNRYISTSHKQMQKGLASTIIISNPGMQEQPIQALQQCPNINTSYRLHIPPPQPHVTLLPPSEAPPFATNSQDSYTAGSLFAQFKP